MKELPLSKPSLVDINYLPILFKTLVSSAISPVFSGYLNFNKNYKRCKRALLILLCYSILGGMKD
jgi:hypothetical protein